MKLRLGLLGAEGISSDRIGAVHATGKATIAAIADPSEKVRMSLTRAAPDAESVASLEKLLELELDGLVIATRSAFQAVQARIALEHGLAVFCQLPLGRSARDAAQLVEVAEQTDRSIGIDRRLRHSPALVRARALVSSGQLGDVQRLVLALETNGRAAEESVLPLIDACEWVLGDRAARAMLDPAGISVELEGGKRAEISFARSTMATDTTIYAELHGTAGKVDLDSAVEPRGGRGLLTWVEKLRMGARFDPNEVEGVVESTMIAEALHRMPAVAGSSPRPQSLELSSRSW